MVFYNLALLAVGLGEICEVADDTLVVLADIAYITVHLAHAVCCLIAFHRQLTLVNIGGFLYFKFKSSKKSIKMKRF